MTSKENITQDQALEDQWLRDLMRSDLADEMPSADLVMRTVDAMNAAAATEQKPAQPAFAATAGAKPRKRTRGVRMRRAVSIAVAACLCCCVVGGGFAYAGETAQVDLSYGNVAEAAQDSEAPRVRLCINRFDRVLKAEGLNEAGRQAVEEHNVWGRSCEQATAILLGSWADRIEADDAISVEVRCEDGAQGERLRQGCEGQVEKHGYGLHGNGFGQGNGSGQGNAEGAGTHQGQGGSHEAAAGQGNGQGGGQDSGSGNGQGNGQGGGSAAGSGNGHGSQVCV